MSNDNSAQPCGCDPGLRYRGKVVGYVCGQHSVEEEHQEMATNKDIYEDGCGVGAASRRSNEPTWGVLNGIKDSGKREKFASGALRDPSTGKIKWSRISFGPMMRRWAQHLTNAEVKYPDPTPGIPNFSLIEGSEELVRYKESAFRHFMSWFHGETDEDHAAATFFNINGVEIIKDKACAKGEEIADPFKRTDTTPNMGLYQALDGSKG